MRINQGQEFVIAGFTPSNKNFDALIIGYCEKANCSMRDARETALRRRSGSSWRNAFARCRSLNVRSTIPEKKSGRWGQGLTAAKMKECRWLKPVLVGQFEFVEWTADFTCRIQVSSPSGVIKRLWMLPEKNREQCRRSSS